MSWIVLRQCCSLFLYGGSLVDWFRLGHLTFFSVVHRNQRLSHWRDAEHWEIRSRAYATKIFTAKQFHKHNGTSATEVDGIAEKIKMLSFVSDCRINPYSSNYAPVWFQSSLSPLKKNAYLKYSGFVFNRLIITVAVCQAHPHKGNSLWKLPNFRFAHQTRTALGI